MLTIYQTPALPLHFIAENEDGQRFLIPAIPNACAAWKAKKLYRGNFKLEKSAPSMQALYGEADATEEESAEETRTESLRIRLSPAEKGELLRLAHQANMSVSAYIRSRCEL
jgi:hypothetical protein